MAFETGKKRVPLYDRLPEIYRIRDHEKEPREQLKSYLALVEGAFSEIHKNIEALYHDLFIETCDPWVIPYIGDLLGVSHLKGDERTLRADVADAIALRRRKGTLAGIERLVYNLSGWGVHCVELRKNLVWNQHLNHQRPDDGGDPPYRFGPGAKTNFFSPIRGGTVTLRDPAMLSLLNTPFDPFGHITDVKPPARGNVRYNLPNLAIFLWRLKDYRITTAQPLFVKKTTVGGVRNLRFHFHPLGEFIRLFNTYQFEPDREPPVVTRLDETPNPIPMARLTMGSNAGRPEKYVAVETYDPLDLEASPLDIADTGIQFHLPEPRFSGEAWPHETDDTWTIRGANLCAWESGVHPPVKDREIIIDPVYGRFIIGVNKLNEENALKKHLLVTYTYGSPGPVGAHPINLTDTPKTINDLPVVEKEVNWHKDTTPSKSALQDAYDSIAAEGAPVVIEIQDSMVHELDPGVQGLQLTHPLIIRAADNERPVIKLAQPLRFRPQTITEGEKLFVRLEGLHITGNNASTPLIARAALNKLEINHCTLDPGGRKEWDTAGGPWKRTSIKPAMMLEKNHGYTSQTDIDAFDQIPQVVINRTITGPLFIDTDYTLEIDDSIIDGGAGVTDDPQYAISGTGPNPEDTWGPPTGFSGITVLGAVRIEEARGEGSIFIHTLEVKNHQTGCIKFSYFQGIDDRLPQNHACIKGSDGYRLQFVSETFGEPAYGQLHGSTDFKIRERGPNDDAMGAFGFLMEAHKWRNLSTRFREFMPVGVRPLLIPVT